MNPELQFPPSIGNAAINGNQLGSWATGMTQVSMPNTVLAGGNTSTPSPIAKAPNPSIGSDYQNGGAGNFWAKDGGAGVILGGVQVLGNLWSSFQANKLAKQQMSFAREQWNTNLENQTKAYNTALEDRIRGRYAAGDRTEEQLQGEINRYSL